LLGLSRACLQLQFEEKKIAKLKLVRTAEARSRPSPIYIA